MKTSDFMKAGNNGFINYTILDNNKI